MSLYQAIFPDTPDAGIILALIGFNEFNLSEMRYRSVGFNEAGQVVVTTRIGGNNRKEYKTAIRVLTTLPHYVKDEDDKHDSTYAYFIFNVPERNRKIVLLLVQRPENRFVTVEDKFAQLYKDLEDNVDNETTRRALNVGKNIFDKVEKAKNGAIVTINDDGSAEVK